MIDASVESFDEEPDPIALSVAEARALLSAAEDALVAAGIKAQPAYVAAAEGGKAPCRRHACMEVHYRSAIRHYVVTLTNEQTPVVVDAGYTREPIAVPNFKSAHELAAIALLNEEVRAALDGPVIGSFIFGGGEDIPACVAPSGENTCVALSIWTDTDLAYVLVNYLTDFASLASYQPSDSG